MNKLLEDKVSKLMATKDENNIEIKGLNSQIVELKDNEKQLNQKIDQLEKIIKTRDSEIVDLKNKIDFLDK